MERGRANERERISKLKSEGMKEEKKERQTQRIYMIICEYACMECFRNAVDFILCDKIGNRLHKYFCCVVDVYIFAYSHLCNQ